MKILLDESVPQKLRLLMDGSHTVVTAWFQGWSGLKNGALLDAAEKWVLICLLLLIRKSAISKIWRVANWRF